MGILSADNVRAVGLRPRRRKWTALSTPSAAMLLAVLLALSACTPAGLVSARQKIAAREYAAAHEQLLALEATHQQLTESERTEVKDDLCLTEFMIGEPAYGLSEQRGICALAAEQPGSRSGPILRKIDDSMRRAAARHVESALAAGDLDGADQAALAYQQIPGADPALLAQWSRRMWKIVAERDRRTRARSKWGVRAAIVQARRLYPATRSMREKAFVAWVMKETTVNGRPMLSGAVMHGRDELELYTPGAELHTAALNIDRFAKINDALVARCGCDGRTNVALSGSRLPLYLIRLDSETRRSEVLILPSP
jgi:hypothetical protein